jgi:hypothetical protein
LAQDLTQDGELKPEAESPPTKTQIRQEVEEPPQPTGLGQAYRSIRRELTEEDLTNPSISRLILNERDRLEGEVSELHSFRDRYHEADKKAAVLEERTRTIKSIEVSFALSLAIGSLFIGLSFRGGGGKVDWCSLVAGGVLLIAGAIARAIKK